MLKTDYYGKTRSMAADAQGLVSVNNKTSYGKISQMLKTTWYVFRIVWSLRNLIGVSWCYQGGCQFEIDTIIFKLPISRLNGI